MGVIQTFVDSADRSQYTRYGRVLYRPAQEMLMYMPDFDWATGAFSAITGGLYVPDENTKMAKIKKEGGLWTAYLILENGKLQKLKMGSKNKEQIIRRTAVYLQTGSEPGYCLRII